MVYKDLATGKVDKNIDKFLENPFKNIPSIEEAVEISKKYEIALHPKYLFYWNELEASEFVSFLKFLKKLKIKIDNENEIENSSISKTKKKTIFENLGIEHKVESVSLDKVHSEDETNILIFNKLNTKILLINLGFDLNEFKIEEFEKKIDKIIELSENNLSKNVCEILSMNSAIEIRDKGGTYIGARMGRPEKAKMRKQFNNETNSHGLFPVGEGNIISTKRFGSDENHEEVVSNRLKNILFALKSGQINENFRIYYCDNCNKDSISPKCYICSNKCSQKHFERYSGIEKEKESDETVNYKKLKLDLKDIETHLRNVLGKDTPYPKHVKGISATINKHHSTEHICKAFLRAKNKVFVNKDGSVRFDMIEMGLTHFKLKEIGTSVKKIKKLGYTQDIDGKEIVNNNQLIEIFPQDVILPDCKESGDEFASDFVINTGNFVDELLEKLYKLPKFYNFKSKEDTIGHLLIGLAPHTSAGIVGRIIGYSKTQGCFSHPVWHAAQRRNLDGDENGVMLLLDGLINFSRDYLPDRRGSRSVTKDTSLFLEENGNLKSVLIGEYIDQKFEKNKYQKEEDEFETLKINNLKTFSFDSKSGCVSLEKISKLIRHPCDKKVYEIKTTDGWIKTTEDHSIFSLEFKTGEIIEKKASELKKGDFIICLGKLNLNSQVNKKISLNKLGIKQDSRSNQISNEIILNEKFFRLLGFIYAEGHIRGNKIEIGNTDKKIIDLLVNDIENLLKYKVNILEDKRSHKYTKGKYYRINLSNSFVKVLKKLGVLEQKVKFKEIPDFVFRSSKENILSFIEGYCLGNGTDYSGDKYREMQRLYTSSVKLASGLSFLAYLCDLKSTCRKSIEKKTNSIKYEVCVSKFKKRSSFWSIYHLRKELNEGLKNSELNILERKLILGNVNLNTRLKTSSKDKILKIIEELSKSSKNKKIIEKLKIILNQDIRLEIVNEVKEIEYEGYVYDLEVPKHQNFLCGPHPIFAHNTMDVSLVLTSHLYLDQIDDEVHGMDIVEYYPLEFYRMNKEYRSPKEIKIEKVETRISREDIDERYLGYKFTHDTDDMNETIMCSSYKSVPSMTEKLDLQLGLAKKIRAVDENQVGSFVIDKHFMKDIKGNLRKFSMQTFRCTNCNTKYRRPPLLGKCTKCGMPSINFTIHEGSIKKYVNPSFKIINEYDVDPYIVETLELANLRIEGVFGKELEKQKGLNEFFKK